MKRRHTCPVCHVAPEGPNGEMCHDCATLALRAYGWAQGTSDGVTLTRGPVDPVARAELDALTAKGRAK